MLKSLRTLASSVCVFFSLLAAAQSPQPAGSVLITVPAIVVGGGFMTKISVVNLTNAPNTVTFNDISSNGALLNSQQFTIAANGTLRVPFDETQRFNPNGAHWAMVGAQGAIAANEFFDRLAA